MNRVVGLLVMLATTGAALAAAPDETRTKAPETATVSGATLADLIRKGQDTAQLVASGKGQFSWTAQLDTGSATFEVTNLVAGPLSKHTLRFLRGSGKGLESAGEVDLFSIIKRDGVWYVREQGKASAKCRPFEAPLRLPSAYLMLAAGNLEVLPPDTADKIESVENGLATVHVAMPAAAKAELEASIAGLRETLGRLDDGPEAEKGKERIAQIEQIIAEGGTVVVDCSTGVVVRDNKMMMDRKFAFSANKRVAVKEFGVAGETWLDLTDDPTVGQDLDDLLMIGNAPMATPANSKQVDPDARLVNLRSRQMRRIPVRGLSCLPGCFSRDRKKAYVQGVDPSVGTMLSLWEINLSTGENRQISVSGPGWPLATSVSPDGTSLAIMKFSLNLKSQLCLLDTKSWKVSLIGGPMDAGAPYWLNDGKGFILFVRKWIAADKPSEDSLARMDLDGTVRVLGTGSQPKVIPGQKKILFEQGRMWYTCDLDGQKRQMYADGMKGYGFPAFSPDGRRILWISFKDLPHPVMQTFGEAKVEELDIGPGLWAAPVWQ